MLCSFIQFKGLKTNVGNQVMVDGHFLDPKESLKFINHSPDGFNWGYGGSGAMQLAFALLLWKTGNVEFSIKHYRKYCGEVISKLPQEDMLSKEIVVFVDEFKKS